MIATRLLEMAARWMFVAASGQVPVSTNTGRQSDQQAFAALGPTRAA